MRITALARWLALLVLVAVVEGACGGTFEVTAWEPPRKIEDGSTAFGFVTYEHAVPVTGVAVTRDGGRWDAWFARSGDDVRLCTAVADGAPRCRTVRWSDEPERSLAIFVDPGLRGRMLGRFRTMDNFIYSGSRPGRVLAPSDGGIWVLSGVGGGLYRCTDADPAVDCRRVSYEGKAFPGGGYILFHGVVPRSDGVREDVLWLYDNPNEEMLHCVARPDAPARCVAVPTEGTPEE